jgi:hypothetical protein
MDGIVRQRRALGDILMFMVLTMIGRQIPESTDAVSPLPESASLRTRLFDSLRCGEMKCYAALRRCDISQSAATSDIASAVRGDSSLQARPLCN